MESQVKRLIVPKKISRVGGGTAIYLDLAILAYLGVLRDDESLKTIKISVEGCDKVFKKPIRFNSKGSAYIGFGYSEVSDLGLVHDDVVAFTITD